MLESLENMILRTTFPPVLAMILMCLTDDLVLPTYHWHLDIYATEAITLSKESLQGVIEILKEANRQWDEAISLLAPDTILDIPVHVFEAYPEHIKLSYHYCYCSGSTALCSM